MTSRSVSSPFLQGRLPAVLLRETSVLSWATPAIQITPITADEYFQRNIEFSKWLKEQKGLLFNGAPASPRLQCPPPPSPLSGPVTFASP